MNLSRGEDLMKSIIKVSDMLICLNDPSADYIKAFCFSIQICFFISVGMVCFMEILSIIYFDFKKSYENIFFVLNMIQWYFFDFDYKFF